MGTQRYLAESIMEHFLVTEDEAYRLAVLVEGAEFIGDDIADAVYPLPAEGDLTRALEQLRSVHELLGDRIAALDVAFSGLSKRRTRK